MRWGLSLAVGVGLFLCVGAGTGQPPGKPDPYAAHIAPTPPRQPAEQQKTFRLPPGFEMQLVASEPEIIHPININFDAKGRLWVTQSVEYPFPAPAGQPTKDAVKVLEDFQPDGRAGKITTFAGDLNIPIGVLPVGDGAIVHSIPNIWRLHDTNGDGKADKKEVLYGTYAFADTHGMTGEFVRGFDGWVYACHGFSNTSTVKARDGSAITMTSGNTYRFKDDGGHVEYFTHGQVNPFGLAFDPLGNLFSCDCHSRPIYQLLRGAWYPSFGKPNDGLGFGPEMMTHSHGSTAIAGIAYYAADHFPKEYHDNIFIGNVVTNRINRDRLERHGSTYRAVEMPDLVSSSDRWFRPVDIKLGPDGALYIADFYTRIIGHYEVPLTHPLRDKTHGRIWRIVYRGPDGKGRPQAPRPDWTKASVEDLVHDLGHPNLTVRLTAAQQLVERGGKEGVQEVSGIMEQGGNNFQRMHGLWVLARQNALDEDTLTAAAREAETGVRVHAMRVLTERRELSAKEHDLALAGLKDEDAFVRRAAAEALGAHPDAANLRPLLDLRHAVPADDTHLLHAVRMALRDQLRPESTWTEIADTRWSERDRAALADVCLGLPTVPSATFLLKYLGEPLPAWNDTVARYVHHAVRYGPADTADTLLERAVKFTSAPALFRTILQATQERGVKLSASARRKMEDYARSRIGSTRDSEVLAALEVAGALKAEALREPVLALVENRKAPEAQRRAAISVLASLQPAQAVESLARILAAAAEPMAVREQAAAALATINQPRAQEELVKQLTAAPAKLQAAIALALAGSKPGAEKLLSAVAAGKASARLLQQQQVQQKLNQAKLPNLKQRLAKLTQGLPRADEKLQEVINRRRDGFAKVRGDATLGLQVFEKNCSACHQIANKGAKIAPQLDGVGVRGVERLLEDILDPSRNVDQAFRATTLTLTNGQIVFGLLVREEGEVLILVDNQGKEQRIGKDAVEGRIVSQMSPMPANFAEQMSEVDLYNLLAYLLAQQAPLPGKSAPVQR